MTRSLESKRARRILAAADELLAEKGYEGVTVASVARRADVNKALVFYYFGSKEGLFERVLEQYYSRHQAVLEQAFERPGTLRERLHHVFDAYLGFIEENLRYPRLIQQQVSSDSPHRDLVVRNLEPLFHWTEKILAEVTPADGHLAARHFFVTFSAMVINYYTYAPILAALWPGDPLDEGCLAERRRHVHWLVDAVLDQFDEPTT